MKWSTRIHILRATVAAVGRTSSIGCNRRRLTRSCLPACDLWSRTWRRSISSERPPPMPASYGLIRRRCAHRLSHLRLARHWRSTCAAMGLKRCPVIVSFNIYPINSRWNLKRIALWERCIVACGYPIRGNPVGAVLRPISFRKLRTTRCSVLGPPVPEYEGRSPLNNQ